MTIEGFDFSKLGTFNKDDVLLIRGQYNRGLVNGMTSHELASFMLLLKEQGYKPLFVPILDDVTIENKDTVKYFLKLALKSLEQE